MNVLFIYLIAALETRMIVTLYTAVCKQACKQA